MVETPIHKQALLLTLISLSVWTLWNIVRHPPHPWADLSQGHHTDHFSHMNAARLFPRVGLDLWRRPVRDQFRALTEQELAGMPEDIRAGGSWSGGVYFVPGWPTDKPLAISWSGKPRPYPPGDLILVAPIAALYHFTPLSLAGANRLLMGWFIVLAHIALFFFFVVFLEAKDSGAAWLGLFLVYGEVMHWTLEGFYDALVLAPLVLAARYLATRRGLATGVAYCLAAALHFRAYFFAPWAIYAAWLVVHDRAWRMWTWRHALALTGAVLCAASSLYVFTLGWPSLRQWEPTNPVLLASLDHLNPRALNLLIVVVVLAAVLVWMRAWLDLAILLWLSIALFTVRQTLPWHILIPMAWLGAPVLRPLVRGVRLGFVMTAAALVYGATVAPAWLWRLF